MNDLPSVTAIRPTERKSLPLRSWLVGLGLAIAVGVVALLATRALSGPSFVSSVAVVNPSAYTLDVEVASASGDEWTQLVSVSPKSTASAEQVVDQGERWAFRAQSAGVAGGEFVVSRADLERADWKVTIPPAIVERLRARGVPDSPPVGF